jgi:hypothetical protein
VHGYIGETRVFTIARIEPCWARLLLRIVWHCGVVAWAAMGALLILAPTMGSERARTAIIVTSAAVYAVAAIGNAWATQGRHFGWAWLSAVGRSCLGRDVDGDWSDTMASALRQCAGAGQSRQR